MQNVGPSILQVFKPEVFLQRSLAINGNYLTKRY